MGGRQQKQPPMQSHLWKLLTTQPHQLPHHARANNHHRYLSTQINSNCCDFSNFIARIPHKMSMSAAVQRRHDLYEHPEPWRQGVPQENGQERGEKCGQNVIFAHGSPTKTASNAEPSVEASDNSAAPIAPPRKGKCASPIPANTTQYLIQTAVIFLMKTK